MLTIGILAVQGAFIEHQKALEKLGCKTFEIRQLRDLLKPMDGVILPGGESTAMHRLLNDLGLFQPLKDMIQNGLPTFGTCAGMILMAKRILHQETHHLQVMNIAVERNAYGRQLGSFETVAKFNKQDIPMTFIRAPYIVSCGPNVEVLAIVKDRMVAARQDHMLATAFHPELSDNLYIHQYFLEMVKSYKK